MFYISNERLSLNIILILLNIVIMLVILTYIYDVNCYSFRANYYDYFTSKISLSSLYKFIIYFFFKFLIKTNDLLTSYLLITFFLTFKISLSRYFNINFYFIRIETKSSFIPIRVPIISSSNI